LIELPSTLHTMSKKTITFNPSVEIRYIPKDQAINCGTADAGKLKRPSLFSLHKLRLDRTGRNRSVKVVSAPSTLVAPLMGYPAGSWVFQWSCWNISCIWF